MDKMNIHELLKNAAQKYAFFWNTHSDKAYNDAIVWMPALADYCVERMKEDKEDIKDSKGNAYFVVADAGMRSVIKDVMDDHLKECHPTPGSDKHKEALANYGIQRHIHDGGNGDYYIEYIIPRDGKDVHIDYEYEYIHIKIGKIE
jgi:hypothetical protein